MQDLTLLSPPDPAVPPQDVDQIAQVDQLLAQMQLSKADRVVKVCRAYEDGARVAPGGEAKQIYVKWRGRAPQDQSWQKEWNALAVLSVSMVKKPSYGTFTVQGNDPAGGNVYAYVPPSPEFKGTDRWSFLVKLSNGKSVLMRYQMEPGIMDRSFYEQKCVFTTRLGQAHLSLAELHATNADLASWQRSANLSALIANAQQTLTGFTDLPATALAQTVGEGAAAAITLDTNAAGHGRYIDPTPLDNSDEYLPTSNIAVWQAKAGSAAAGKMDILSVLLHEYGHALGREHSAEAGDYMNASLQPGMRKLPTADQLELMSQLAAQLRGESQADPEQSDQPDQPGHLPLSMLGLLPFGFVRRSDGAAVKLAPLSTAFSAASDAVAVRTHDYLSAVNPRLTGGSFSAGLVDWEHAGAVSLDSNSVGSNQTVTLGEAPGTAGQTRLAQAFILNPQDRFLTFTVSGLNLQSNNTQQNGVVTAAPQDAFEVALLDANTGANLLTNAVGFAPRLVASAQHGQVSLSAPAGVFGGFVYTPDANFFGSDRFSCSSNDGDLLGKALSHYAFRRCSRSYLLTYRPILYKS